MSEIERLIQVMKDLRDPENGCPWNRDQTHKSLRRHLLEETYETLEAIDNGDNAHIREELGDLLLQVVFHCRIAEEDNLYNIEDVAGDIADKMIRRHPHVFDKNCELDAQTSLNRWDEIKKQEKASQRIEHESILDGVSKELPALYEADKISKKVAKKGFDWEKPEDVFEKLAEEIGEVKQAIASGDADHLEEEMGDLLFTVANLCRVYKVNSEIALRRANQKFRSRFRTMEKLLKEEAQAFEDLNFESWNRLWEQAKKD